MDVSEEVNKSGTNGCYVCMKRCWDVLQRNALVVSSLAAVFLGIALGSILKFYVNLSDHNQLYIRFPGEVLLRMLEMITIPLIVSSVITSFSVPVGIPEKVAMRASAYFLLTTFLSMTLANVTGGIQLFQPGLILVRSIKPGVDAGRKVDAQDDDLFSFVEVFLDLVWNLAQENLIRSCYQHYKTQIIEFEIEDDSPRFSLEANATFLRAVHHEVEGSNILGLIVWSLIFGLVLNRMGQCTDFYLEAVTVLNEVTKHAVNMILWYVPFGLLFMITSIVLEVDDWGILFKLVKFMGVVVFGHFIHGILVLPLTYFLCARHNPYAVIKGFLPALMTAFVSSSSAAALPLTLKCCEERLKINKRISSFMLPIVTKINLDGTVLYELVAAVFIAQLNNINLNLKQWITIAMTSAVSSVGAAGIPARGSSTTFFVLTAVGLPAKEACILVFVECLLDRFNTVVNVLGDCFGVALIHQVSKRDLENTEQGQEMKRINGSDADSQTPDEIQVHISSQASDDDSLKHRAQKKTSFQHSDAEEPIQDEDQTKEDFGFEILCSPPEL